MAAIASVVRPMNVIGRFSIMPSWKDEGKAEIVPLLPELPSIREVMSPASPLWLFSRGKGGLI